jgi:hypothetical protein
MSVIVDYSFYAVEYRGTEADEASFPTLCAHASRMVALMTRNAVTEDNIDTIPSMIRMMYRLAVCSQIDFLAINGIESANGGSDTGFTVGKVRVDGKSAAKTGGALSGSISPAAIAYLEQTGLMNPQVPTLEGWW